MRPRANVSPPASSDFLLTESIRLSIWRQRSCLCTQGDAAPPREHVAYTEAAHGRGALRGMYPPISAHVSLSHSHSPRPPTPMHAHAPPSAWRNAAPRGSRCSTAATDGCSSLPAKLCRRSRGGPRAPRRGLPAHRWLSRRGARSCRCARVGRGAVVGVYVHLGLGTRGSRQASRPGWFHERQYTIITQCTVACSQLDG